MTGARPAPATGVRALAGQGMDGSRRTASRSSSARRATRPRRAALPAEAAARIAALEAEGKTVAAVVPEGEPSPA